MENLNERRLLDSSVPLVQRAIYSVLELLTRLAGAHSEIGLSDLVEKTGMAERTVSRHVSDLKKLGWISAKQRHDINSGKFLGNVFVIDGLPNSPSATDDRPSESPPAIIDRRNESPSANFDRPSESPSANFDRRTELPSANVGKFVHEIACVSDLSKKNPTYKNALNPSNRGEICLSDVEKTKCVTVGQKRQFPDVQQNRSYTYIYTYNIYNTYKNRMDDYESTFFKYNNFCFEESSEGESMIKFDKESKKGQMKNNCPADTNASSTEERLRNIKKAVDAVKSKVSRKPNPNYQKEEKDANRANYGPLKGNLNESTTVHLNLGLVQADVIGEKEKKKAKRKAETTLVGDLFNEKMKEQFKIQTKYKLMVKDRKLIKTFIGNYGLDDTFKLVGYVVTNWRSLMSDYGLKGYPTLGLIFSSFGTNFILEMKHGKVIPEKKVKKMDKIEKDCFEESRKAAAKGEVEGF